MYFRFHSTHYYFSLNKLSYWYCNGLQVFVNFPPLFFGQNSCPRPTCIHRLGTDAVVHSLLQYILQFSLLINIYIYVHDNHIQFRKSQNLTEVWYHWQTGQAKGACAALLVRFDQQLQQGTQRQISISFLI